MPRAPAPTCCSPSAGRHGPICWRARCLPNSSIARPRSLRTTPIIAKDRAMRLILTGLAALLVAGAGAMASVAPADFAAARREAAAAEARYRALEAQVRRATNAAERARARSAALAARIEAAEAALTLAERPLGRGRPPLAAQ